MKVKFKIYAKKDGSKMIYANSDRGVSLGIAESWPAKYGKFKLSAGQIKLLDAINVNKMANVECAVELASDFNDSLHKEESFDNAIGKIYITDTANVAGISTGSDGAFVRIGNKLINLAQEFEF
jgi:hypothetical protein